MPLSGQQRSSLQLGSLINVLRSKDPVLANALSYVQNFSDVTDNRIRELSKQLQGILGSGNEFVARFRRVAWEFPGMAYQIFLPSVPGVVFPGAAMWMNWPGYNLSLYLTPFEIAYRVNSSAVSVFSISADPVTAGGIISLSTAAGVPQFQAGNGNVAAINLIVGQGSGGPSVTGTGKFQHVGDTVRLFDANRTPANSAAAGNDGEMCADNGFVFFHTGGSWRRVAIATF